VAHAARRWPARENAADRALRRALALIAKGKISDAFCLLDSHGIADIARPEVLAQMVAKHPVRVESVDAVLDGVDDAPHLWVLPADIETAFRHLDTDKAAGASAWRYENLTALVPTVPFPSLAAADAAAAGAYFATRFANGALPAWVNFVFSYVQLLALRKRAPTADEPEDVRPIGISCALRRAVTKTIFANASLKETCAGHIAPQQLGVAVAAVATKLIIGLRELLDAEPSIGVFTLDISNAFNSVSRAAVLRQLSDGSVPGKIGALARLAHATLGPQAPVFAGGGSGGAPLTQLLFRSSEGVQQGSVEGSYFFAAAIQPALVALDAELTAVGGAARAGHDDVYAVGPLALVAAALSRFERALAGLGLHANLAQVGVLSRSALR